MQTYASQPAECIIDFGAFGVQDEVVTFVVDGQAFCSDLSTDPRQRWLNCWQEDIRLVMIGTEGYNRLLRGDGVFEYQVPDFGGEGEETA